MTTNPSSRRQFLKVLGAGAGAAAAARLDAPSAYAQATGPVKIGVLTIRAGVAAPVGAAGLRATEWWAERVNKSGGILGRQVQLVVEEESNPKDTVERYRTLLAEAEARLKKLDLLNVITRFGDGGEGWPEQAPFDRIMVTAAAPGEPKKLLAQLKPNGILVAPVGRGPVQVLVRYVGDGEGGFRRENLGEVRFIPLVEGVAREL